MSNNGKKEEGTLRKKCPFDKQWCIAEACDAFIQINQARINQLGQQQMTQVGMCSLPALTQIMSSLVQIMASRPLPPPQMMKIPPFFKG